jgi:hypothetical protein
MSDLTRLGDSTDHCGKVIAASKTMDTTLRFSTIIVASILVVLGECARAETQTWECSIARNGTEHELTVRLGGGRVVGFDYLATTRSEAGANSCSITTDDYNGVPKISGNISTFPLLSSDATIVIKNGETILLDLSSAEVSNYCG